MTRKTMALTALLFGFGCSHATPKPETPAKIVGAPRSLPPPVAQVARETPSTLQAPQDSNEAIYFDFDSANIKRDARPTLQEVGEQLVHNHRKIRIEGNCDERGTTEYNLALGDRRAREAKLYLERLGVSGKRISVLSYGSERPKFPGHNERSWAKNRRDDFRVQ
jgi:peptidoglycan-associated lipoprotein